MNSTAGELVDRQPAGPCFDDAHLAELPYAADALTAVRRLASTNSAAMADDECLAAYDQLELITRSLTAAATAMLGEIDARDLCDRRYGTTTRVWWERRHGRSRRSVGTDASVARRLRTDLPLIAQALADGHITHERVALIASKTNARNAAGMTAAQEALLELSAAEPSFNAFAALIDDLARYADPDGGHDPASDHSTLNTRRVGNELVLHGSFTGADGASLDEHLEAATSRLWRQWVHDLNQCPELTMPTRAQLRAQALLEMIHTAAGTTPSSRSRPRPPELTVIVDGDRVNDLDPILSRLLNAGLWPPPRTCLDHDHETGSGTGAGCGAAAGCAAGVGDIVGLPLTAASGAQVWFTAQQWQLLVCNTDISEVLLDQLGMPIAVRDRLRSPNRAMRRTLNARDGGCAFPGCDAPPNWCDAHHVVEYDPDGKTVTTNLVLLCRRHHGIIHRTGWQISLTPPGTPVPQRGQGLFTITTAGGLQLFSQHRQRPARSPSDRPPDRQPQLT